MNINDLKTEDTNEGVRVSSDKGAGHRSAGWLWPFVISAQDIADGFRSLFAHDHVENRAVSSYFSQWAAADSQSTRL